MSYFPYTNELLPFHQIWPVVPLNSYYNYVQMYTVYHLVNPLHELFPLQRWVPPLSPDLISCTWYTLVHHWFWHFNKPSGNWKYQWLYCLCVLGDSVACFNNIYGSPGIFVQDRNIFVLHLTVLIKVIKLIENYLSGSQCNVFHC